MLPSSRATMGPEITIGAAELRVEQCWPLGLFFTVAVRRQNPVAPREQGEERPADAPPSALRETEKARSARGSRKPFSRSAHCQIAKQCGVPHPDRERKEARGSGDSVCLRPLLLRARPPRGLAAGARARARPACPLRLPGPGSCHLARPDLLQAPRYPRVGKQQSWGCHWAPATCVPTLGASDPAVLS